MREQETEIIFLLDRSGSMNTCEEDTIGGYNSFLDMQKAASGRAYVTTVLFDNRYEVLCEHEDIQTAKHISSNEYFARGATALLDAIGLTIASTSQRQAEQADSVRTLMVIITDGLDNISRAYDIKAVYDMIREQQDKHGWEFIFLAADMESIRTAQSIGISSDRSGNFTKEAGGMRSKFDGISGTVSRFRSTGEINQDWTT